LAQQLADRHALRFFGIKKLGSFGDARADVEPGGPNQQPKHVGNAPAPIDQLLMRELRGQHEAEQRGDDRGHADRSPLPACAVAAALSTMLDQEGDRAAELAATEKPCSRRATVMMIGAASPIVAKPGVTTISVVPISISPIESVSPALRPARSV